MAALFYSVGAAAGDDGPAVVSAWLAKQSDFGLGGVGVAAGGAGCGGGVGNERSGGSRIPFVISGRAHSVLGAILGLAVVLLAGGHTRAFFDLLLTCGDQPMLGSLV